MLGYEKVCLWHRMLTSDSKILRWALDIHCRVDQDLGERFDTTQREGE